MLTFLWPWALLSLLAVAAAAAVSLRRPLHQVVPVSSLRLWRRAVEALGSGASRRARTIPAGWLVLLLGAALAATALARPVWRSARPARRIAIAITPSAELGQETTDLAKIVAALLDRLDDEDRVQLILPAAMGGSSEYLPAAEARRRVGSVRVIPAAAADLSLPAGRGYQHLYHLTPAAGAAQDGPRTTVIAIPGRIDPVTIDAFAAEPLGRADKADRVQILLALRNQTSQTQRGRATISGADGSTVSLTYSIAPRGRQVLLTEADAGETFSAAVADATGWGGRAHLAARRRAIAKVALIGRDDPLVRRFVTVNPALTIAAEEAANAVVAIGIDPPPRRPGLVIDPPSPPPGYMAGRGIDKLALREADIARQHRLLAHVDLSAVAVRHGQTWRAVGRVEPPLISVGGEAIAAVQRMPRRVYLSFDTAADNTNLPLSEAYVILLTNVFDYLLGDRPGVLSYESVTPIQAGPGRNWLGIDGDGSPAPAGLPQPGLYADQSGRIHAVSLTGLRGTEPQIDPRQRLAAAPLPDPTPRGADIPLWPWLAGVAAIAWILGWRLRAR